MLGKLISRLTGGGTPNNTLNGREGEDNSVIGDFKILSMEHEQHPYNYISWRYKVVHLPTGKKMKGSLLDEYVYTRDEETGEKIVNRVALEEELNKIFTKENRSDFGDAKMKW